MKHLKHLNKRKRLTIAILTLLSLISIIYPKITPLLKSNNQNKTETHTVSPNAQKNDLNLPNWSYDQYPDYYAENGTAVIDETKFPEIGNINYTGKDELGRTLSVYGVITMEMVYKSSAEERPDFKKGDNPSGWNKNEKVSVQTSSGEYNGWFWNRSHLVADRLGGATNSDNAITGTRMQNVGNRSNSGGMAYVEQLTVDYLTTHRGEHVYYSAEPIYSGSELIPRYVIVNVKSSDNLLDKQIITFNNQYGYTIDYTNGTFTKD